MSWTGQRHNGLSGLVLLAAAATMVSAGAEQATFRSATRTVTVPVTVHDERGRLVAGLQAEDFEIFEDGHPVSIAQFTSDPQPLTLMLMLDTSTSASPNIVSVRRAATAAIESLAPDDRARIGTFGAEIAVSPHLTGATWQALDALAGDAGPRRTLILLTDGADTTPSASTAKGRTAGDVHSRARRDQWSIYAVVPHGSVGRDLRTLVDDTGGRIVSGQDARGLAATFSRLMEELKQQYLLGFPSSKTDGRVHTIDVRLRRSDLRVTARKSYQANTQ